MSVILAVSLTVSCLKCRSLAAQLRQTPRGVCEQHHVGGHDDAHGRPEEGDVRLERFEEAALVADERAKVARRQARREVKG